MCHRNINVIQKDHKTTYPLVSVIGGVYNTPKSYVSLAIKSILNQDYKNFELIIIDDGSKIDYMDLIASMDDRRIIYKKNTNNMGLAYSLNRGIELSKGDLIARMDFDDISYPNRLYEMVKFFNENENISIAGSFCREFDGRNRIIVLEQEDKYIRPSMLFKNPLAHPTVVFRKKIIDKYDIRYDVSKYPEDYYLWVKLSLNKNIIFSNNKAVLLLYRIHDNQITRKMKPNTLEIISEILDFFEIKINSEERDAINNVYNNNILDKNQIDIFLAYLNSIIKANNKYRFYEEEALKNVLAEFVIKKIIRNNLYLYFDINWCKDFLIYGVERIIKKELAKINYVLLNK